MTIKNLWLHNFGIYAGDNILNFNSKKPVVLIGGMNGRGKTTILEAVLLALYGVNSFAVAESEYKTYGHYLRAHTNKSDNTNESFVSLEFVINYNGENNTYMVKRSWNAGAKKIFDNIYVEKNGHHDEFISKNWSMFIESILPSGLANIFFFDGEKIAELAVGETNAEMKKSIKALLGINVIDSLSADLNRVINKLNSETNSNYEAAHIEELRAEKEGKDAALADIDKQIEAVEAELSKAIDDLNKKNEEFKAKGGDIVNEAQDLYSERGTLNGKISQINSDFIELAASELPLALTAPLLFEIREQSEKEQQNKNAKMALKKINELISSFSQETPDDSKVLKKFSKYVSKSIDNDSQDIFNLSELAQSQCVSLISYQLNNAASSYQARKDELDKAEKRIAEIDEYLSVDIDEKSIRRIYKEICQLNALIDELQVKGEELKKARVTAHGEALKATAEFKKCVSHYLSVLERDDDTQRIRAYALIAQQVANEYKIELQRSKIERLANTMTECYKKLLDKKNLINHIDIDCESLDYYCVDNNGDVIPKSSLSAGEKQLMVISMLWALAICSNNKLPVIIDTPLARMDSVHRKALITKYFPHASEQTVLLSTDSEIDGTYYNHIKKYVGSEFTLCYNEESKSSKVTEGYFEGVIDK